MKIVKKFVRDENTELVSHIFNKVITSQDYHLPFEALELNIGDSDISSVEDCTAAICLDHNNPFVVEKDRKGLDIIIRRELFRLMFKMDVPKAIEDVIIDRELVKRGFGNDIFYMHYTYVMKSRVSSLDDFIQVNLPWIAFHGYDKHDSEFLKKLVAKISKKKFPETRKFFNLLCSLSPSNLRAAVEEYSKLFR